MDIRLMLNSEDRPQMASRNGQQGSQRSTSRRSVSNNTGRSTIRSTGNPIKIEPSWSSQAPSVLSPTDSVSSTAMSWTQSLSPITGSTAIRPRITTSITGSTQSTTNKRRASARSPVSGSSSSSSSPSPPTPCSTLSNAPSYGSSSSSMAHQYHYHHHHKQRVPDTGGEKVEHCEALPGIHQYVIQPQYTVSITPGRQHSKSDMYQSPPVHLNRVLPLPSCSRSVAQQTTRQQVSSPQSQRPSTSTNPASIPIKPIPSSSSGSKACSAVSSCDNKTPKRRIVSQFFGRNKKETRLIPRHCWIYYCRQHYQRSRYRLSPARFADLQMSLVRATVRALEQEGIVLSWDIKLRKRALERLGKSSSDSKTGKKGASTTKSTDPASSSSAANPTGSRERLLVPFTGQGKSFAQVYEVLDAVSEICRHDGGVALEFEILPTFTVEYVHREEARRRAGGKDAAGSDSDSEDEDD